MRSTAEMLMFTEDMDERGNASVINMYRSIHSVNCALRKVCLFRLVKFITKGLCPRVELMREIISLLYANRVMQRYMPSEEIIKEVRNTVFTATINRGRGGQNLKKIDLTGNGVGSYVRKKQNQKGN